MSGIPSTRHQMIRAGYKLLRTQPCRDCSAPIQLWKTTHGKYIAFNAPTPGQNDYDEAEPHRSHCTGPVAKPDRALTTTERQQHTTRLAQATKARIVLALYDDAETFSAHVHPGIKPEDARHELITAANKLRNLMEAKR